MDDCPVSPHGNLICRFGYTRRNTRKMPTLDFKLLCYKMTKNGFNRKNALWVHHDTHDMILRTLLQHHHPRAIFVNKNTRLVHFRGCPSLAKSIAWCFLACYSLSFWVVRHQLILFMVRNLAKYPMKRWVFYVSSTGERRISEPSTVFRVFRCHLSNVASLHEVSINSHIGIKTPPSSTNWKSEKTHRKSHKMSPKLTRYKQLLKSWGPFPSQVVNFSAPKMAAPHLQHVSPGQWITHQVPTSYGSAATVSPRGTTWRATERHRGTAGIQ